LVKKVVTSILGEGIILTAGIRKEVGGRRPTSKGVAVIKGETSGTSWRIGPQKNKKVFGERERQNKGCGGVET